MSDVPNGQLADESQSAGLPGYEAASSASGDSSTADIPGGAGSQSGMTQQDSTVPPIPAELASKQIRLGATGSGTGIGTRTQTEPTAKAQPELEQLDSLVEMFLFLSNAQTVSSGAAQAPSTPRVVAGRAGMLGGQPAQGFTPIAGAGTMQLAMGYDTIPTDTILAIAGEAGISDPRAFVQMWQSGQLSDNVVQQIRPVLNKQLQSSLKGFGVNVNASGPAGLSQEALQNALFTQMPADQREQLEQEGYQVAGSTLGDFIASIAQRGTATSVSSALASAPTTIAQAYQQFVKEYLANPRITVDGQPSTYAQQMRDMLGQAGLINSTAASDTQVYQAYQNILQYAAQHNQTVRQVFSTLSSGAAPPGEVEDIQIGEIGNYIRSVASQYGVNLTPSQFNNIVYTAQNLSWTEENDATDIQQLVASSYTYDPNQTQGGYAGVIENTIKASQASTRSRSRRSRSATT
jgi:hypothetical protein